MLRTSSQQTLREVSCSRRVCESAYPDLDSSSDPDAKGTFGTWDSLHVFEVATVTGTEGTTSVQSAKYKLSSTVMLTLDRREGGVGPLGNVDLSGSLTRQVRNLVTDSETEETMKVSDAAGHVVNLGRIVEEVESKIRNQLQVRIMAMN